jgi:hypothetical protein
MQIRSFTGPHGSGPNRTFGKFVPNTKEEEERYRRLAAEMDVEDDRNRDSDGNKRNGAEEGDTEESNDGSDVDNDDNYSEDDVGEIDDELLLSTLASINILRFRLNKTKSW